jgi:hypothetical protein
VIAAAKNRLGLVRGFGFLGWGQFAIG